MVNKKVMAWMLVVGMMATELHAGSDSLMSLNGKVKAGHNGFPVLEKSACSRLRNGGYWVNFSGHRLVSSLGRPGQDRYPIGYKIFAVSRHHELCGTLINYVKSPLMPRAHNYQILLMTEWGYQSDNLRCPGGDVVKGLAFEWIAGETNAFNQNALLPVSCPDASP